MITRHHHELITRPIPPVARIVQTATGRGDSTRLRGRTSLDICGTNRHRGPQPPVEVHAAATQPAGRFGRHDRPLFRRQKVKVAYTRPNPAAKWYRKIDTNLRTSGRCRVLRPPNWARGTLDTVSRAQGTEIGGFCSWERADGRRLVSISSDRGTTPDGPNGPIRPCWSAIPTSTPPNTTDNHPHGIHSGRGCAWVVVTVVGGHVGPYTGHLQLRPSGHPHPMHPLRGTKPPSHVSMVRSPHMCSPRGHVGSLGGPGYAF